ncbi:MAG: DNA-processing protein DprA [Pseudomonadota bacterium]
MRESIKIEPNPGGLTTTEKCDWLQLARTPRIGPVTFFQLLARYGSASKAIDALPSLRSGRSKLKIAARAEIEREWQALSDFGANVVCACEDTYPSLLKQFAPPPPVLTMIGRPPLAQKRCVAIVGARQASAAGRKIGRDIAAALSAADFTIVSGLARGIDGEAHAASLNGGTIAVLGGGIDHIYPPQHTRLYGAIRDTGLLISESPFGHRATARDFPRRNRIVTGISEGVVIIEAAERSGSLISARTAMEQNREVMSVPGSPLDPRSAGNNRLLRDGATLVRHADDVIEALTVPLTRRVNAPDLPRYEDMLPPDIGIPEAQIERVQALLSTTPISIPDLARAAGLSEPRCAAVLVELELSGEAVTFPGGFAALAV